jgi:putative peptidoglycan lipid II flippase
MLWRSKGRFSQRRVSNAPPDAPAESRTAQPPETARDSSYTSRSGAFIGSIDLLARISDRLLALVQVVVIAGLFGTSPQADLFFLAAIAPLTIGIVIGEPLGRGFVSLLARRDSHEHGVQLAASGLVGVTAVLVTVTAVYSGIVVTAVHAFRPTETGSAAPWIAFATLAPALGLNAYFGGVLLWLECYVWSAIRVPLASALGLALLGLAAHLTSSVTWFALALSAGSWITALLLYGRIASILSPAWPLKVTRRALSDARGVHRQVLPPILGGAIGGQVIVMIERLLAAGTLPGAVAIIAYARGISGAPAVVGQALGAGSYPGIVKAESVGSTDYVREMFFRGFRLTLYLGAAFSLVMLIFSNDVTVALLQRGALSLPDAKQAGRVLAAFALSTFSTTVLTYLIAVLYGVRDFRAVFTRSLVVFGSYVVIALIFRAATTATSGLALAFSLAQTIGAVLAADLIARRIGVGRRELLRRAVLPPALQAAAVATVLVLYRTAIDTTGASTAVRVTGAAACLIVASSCLLLASPMPEARRLRSMLRLGS